MLKAPNISHYSLKNIKNDGDLKERITAENPKLSRNKVAKDFKFVPKEGLVK